MTNSKKDGDARIHYGTGAMNSKDTDNKIREHQYYIFTSSHKDMKEVLRHMATGYALNRESDKETAEYFLDEADRLIKKLMIDERINELNWSQLHVRAGDFDEYYDARIAELQSGGIEQ